MRQIEDMRARVEAAEPQAELLGAAWDAFTLVLDTCHACEEQAPELFAALAFAAAAASRGRLMLASAPSFPISAGSRTRHDAFVKPDLENVAGALGSLADSLHDRLRQASVEAPAAGDREACAEAAAHAAQVFELLSRDG